jgi:hypothetical protein
MQVGTNWRGFYYFDCQTLLVAFVVVFAEVIANAIGLAKKTNGVVPGVWSPILLASLSSPFSIFSPTDVWANGQRFFRHARHSTHALQQNHLPRLFLGDYLLFGEKGTVKWKHPIFWEPLSFILFCLFACSSTRSGAWLLGGRLLRIAVSLSLRRVLFAGNGGWNGVVICSFLAWLCFFAVAILLVFLNNVLAGAYRKRTPSDVI